MHWPGRSLQLAKCEPSLRVLGKGDVESQSKMIQADAQFHITFSFSDVEHRQYQQGFCWSIMFRNTTLVQGYPIFRRPLQGTGLEATLDVLSKLVRAKTLEDFNERLYLQGFSSMLVSAGAQDGMVYWHHVFNDTGRAISYLDIDRERTAQVHWVEAERARHIVGWSPEITYHAGE